MTLFTVCAILVIDTLAASAKVGVSSLAWWVITFVFFFVPYGLIVAELGAAYPGEGGKVVHVGKPDLHEEELGLVRPRLREKGIDLSQNLLRLPANGLSQARHRAWPRCAGRCHRQ